MFIRLIDDTQHISAIEFRECDTTNTALEISVLTDYMKCIQTHGIPNANVRSSFTPEKSLQLVRIISISHINRFLPIIFLCSSTDEPIS